ncbi:glycosyltransferase family 2 protein [Pontiellaceae bacterium B1224]|nr:glycosyltransferase family 2 protein [Pontiellaceae bacterium B1224]
MEGNTTEKLPGVSIYIITYLDSEERCKVLLETCRVALMQRYPQFEVVVSDNAGEIPAEDALASINDERLKIFRNKKNLGMAGNMNRCVERCRYDILKLNCDDDLLHPDSLARCVPLVDDDTLVINDMQKFTIGTAPEGLGVKAKVNPRVVERSAGYRSDFWRIKYDALPGDTLCTKNLFNELGGYDLLSEVDDWDFAVRCRLRKRIVNVKSILCYQGVWDFSLTEKMLKEEPYYFPKAGLHTYFKIMRDESMKWYQKMHCGMVICKGFFINSLRALKYLNVPEYRTGYTEYRACILKKLLPRH